MDSKAGLGYVGMFKSPAVIFSIDGCFSAKMKESMTDQIFASHTGG